MVCRQLPIFSLGVGGGSTEGRLLLILQGLGRIQLPARGIEIVDSVALSSELSYLQDVMPSVGRIPMREPPKMLTYGGFTV